MKTPFAICALGSSAVVGAAPLALFGSIVMAAPDAKRAPRVSAVGEVIGSDWRYAVRKGDTLLGISRRFFTDPGTLARLNYISNGQVRPGRSLRIPSLHILPLRTEEGVLLNIPERALYVFRRRLVVGRYPVAVGMRSWPTPVGSYEILSMVVDPVWVTPMEMVQREGAAPAALPAHQKSPLGD